MIDGALHKESKSITLCERIKVSNDTLQGHVESKWVATLIRMQAHFIIREKHAIITMSKSFCSWPASMLHHRQTMYQASAVCNSELSVCNFVSSVCNSALSACNDASPVYNDASSVCNDASSVCNSVSSVCNFALSVCNSVSIVCNSVSSVCNYASPVCNPASFVDNSASPICLCMSYSA